MVHLKPRRASTRTTNLAHLAYSNTNTKILLTTGDQIATADSATAPTSHHELQTMSRWQVPRGAADGFRPPWAKTVYDARLFSHAGQLFVTYNCRGCSFSVSHLQMTARVTPDGGLRELRAWADHRLVPLQGKPTRHWLQGRNQALFSAPTSPPPEINSAAASSVASTQPPEELMVQPWLGLIGSLGVPRFTQSRVNCSHGRYDPTACAHFASGVHRLVRVGGHDRAWRRRSAKLAGRVAGAQAHAPYGDAALKYNHSAQVAALDPGGAPRLSTTANLLRVRRPAAAAAAADDAARGRCEAYLGIGHLHRGVGEFSRNDMKMSKDRYKPTARGSHGKGERIRASRRL